MRKIPIKLREELSNDPFYSKCCISGARAGIEWHHNLCFRNRQVNERFAILPLNYEIHKRIDTYRDMCDWIMWNRASKEQIKKYSKCVDYQRVLNNLNKKFGKYKSTIDF